MDLQTFVTQTLASIIEGVKAAQTSYPVGSGSGAVNHIDRDPSFAGLPDLNSTAIEFDIAITSNSSEEHGGEKKGALNIRVIEAGASAKNTTSARAEEVSRVKFTVPVSLPVTETSAHHDANERANAHRRGRIVYNNDGIP